MNIPEHEIIIGNDEICKTLGFESSKVYVYKVPNLFPFEKECDTGWTEFNVQQLGFHADWNMLVGAYNRILLILHNMSETGKKLLQDDKNFFARWGTRTVFMVSDINHQINIESAWRKMVDFCKWYNQVLPIIK